MNIQELIISKVKEAVATIFEKELESAELQTTRKEIEGDLTVVIFSMLRTIKGNPQLIGEVLGAYLELKMDQVIRFNVVKGFLNLFISDTYFLVFFNVIRSEVQYEYVSPEPGSDAFMVEYSSPTTNKLLHRGHIRNNLLGYSVSEILKASGKKVYKTQIINDRGI